MFRKKVETNSNVAAADPPVLNYAKPRWTMPRWIALLCALILMVGIAIWFRGQPLWEQADYLLKQRRLMNFHQAAEMIIYEEEPQKAADLLVDTSKYMGVLESTFAAACWPVEFKAVRSQSEEAGEVCVAFLHHRRSSNGGR